MSRRMFEPVFKSVFRRTPLLTAVGAALLTGMTAGCGRDEPPEEMPPPAPALWEIASADGTVEGWLFGTIHALPDGIDWRTDTLEQVTRQADVLVVEVAELEDRAAVAQVFRELAVTPGQPSLFARVPVRHHAALRDLLETADVPPDGFGATESWAAALTLARLASASTAGSDSGNGADIALLQQFAGRPVVELEGARAQLAIFDGLPEREQRDLLVAIVADHAKTAADPDRAPDRLARAWRAGDMDLLARETTQGFLADPELRAALLTGRNRDWSTRIAALLTHDAKPLVAVGASHMAGADGLPALLSRAGYTTRRIQ